MKKQLGMLAVVSAILVGFTACNSSSGQEATNDSPKRDTVIIKMMAFQPNDVTVNKGDTIVWINEDIVAHDVSQYPDKIWHSDTLQPHDSFEKVIEDSASYFCSIHPTMRARYDVKE